MTTSTTPHPPAPAPRRPAPPARLLPLLLYPFVAAVILWPFAPPALRHAGDMHAVIAAVVEARNALAEGQFPIRVAPRQLEGTRYPLFQFYGNFPYTAAGLLHAIPGVDPYAAWKVVMFASLVVGGWFMFRTAVLITGQRRGHNAAVAAGAAFMAAPYMLTDLYGRGAFAEAVAFCLLPAMLHFALRAAASPSWRRVPAAAVAWALVGLSHNITYLYSSAILGMLMLVVMPPWKWRRPRASRGVACVAAAAGLQAGLLAWYFVPQWLTLDQLNITAEQAPRSPARSDGRVPLDVLLAPRMVPLPANATLGMQAGWPVLGGAAFAIAGAVVWRRSRVPRRVRSAAVGGGLVVVAACFMAWSPVDFWQYLPGAFRFVQFPYRLLVFAVTAGALAIACAVAMWTPPRARPFAAVVTLALVGLTASTYAPPPIPLDPQAVPHAVANPVTGGLNDYLIVPRQNAIETFDASPVVRPLVLYYPRLLDVRVDGASVQYRAVGPFVAADVPAGTHRVDVRFIGIRWANWASSIGWVVVAIGTGMAVLKRSHAKPSLWTTRSVALTFVGAAALLLGWRASHVSAGIARIINPPVTVTATASRPSVPQRTVDLAFDGDPLTEWLAAGSAPVSVTLVPSRPAVPRRIELDVRNGEQLYEGWQRVRVEQFRDGKPVGTATFELTRAGEERVATIVPPAAVVDRLELHFDVPVTKLRDGSRHVDAGAVNPGYREIRIVWEKAP